jgi:5'-3' exonuclease
VGDSSDNIKGVPGIGPKTAARLLQKHGTLKKILSAKNDEEVGKKILPFRDQALLAEKLVTLQSDAPLGIRGLGELEVRESKEGLKNYFRDKGFSSLLAQLEGGGQKKEKKADKPERQASFF